MTGDGPAQCTSSSQVPRAIHQQQAAGSGQQAAGSRQQAAGSRQQAARAPSARRRTCHAEEDAGAVVCCCIGHDVQGCQAGLAAGAHEDEHLQQEKEVKTRGQKGGERGKKVSGQCQCSSGNGLPANTPTGPCASKPALVCCAGPTQASLLWRRRQGLTGLMGECDWMAA
jgi:hypothetical protein